MTIKELKQNWAENPPCRAVCPVHGEYKPTLAGLLDSKRRGMNVGEWGDHFRYASEDCNAGQMARLEW